MIDVSYRPYPLLHFPSLQRTLQTTIPPHIDMAFEIIKTSLRLCWINLNLQHLKIVCNICAYACMGWYFVCAYMYWHIHPHIHLPSLSSHLPLSHTHILSCPHCGRSDSVLFFHFLIYALTWEISSLLHDRTEVHSVGSWEDTWLNGPDWLVDNLTHFVFLTAWTKAAPYLSCHVHIPWQYNG